MATLDDPILIEDLEENLADDPYGTASYVIRNTINRALKLEGQMNHNEFQLLDSLRTLLDAR